MTTSAGGQVQHLINYVIRKSEIASSVQVLHDPGSNSRWGGDFPHLFRTALGPTQPPVQLALGLFPESKAPAAWRRTPNTFQCRGSRKSRFIILLPFWV
jgi:hypothetical protein